MQPLKLMIQKTAAGEAADHAVLSKQCSCAPGAGQREAEGWGDASSASWKESLPLLFYSCACSLGNK